MSGITRVSQYQKVHFAIFWIFWCKMNITHADAPTIPMDCHPIQTNRCPYLYHPHHFYARCPSWQNPPNLSWLGTGTKYAGLHTQWLGSQWLADNAGWNYMKLAVGEWSVACGSLRMQQPTHGEPLYQSPYWSIVGYLHWIIDVFLCSFISSLVWTVYYSAAKCAHCTAMIRWWKFPLRQHCR